MVTSNQRSLPSLLLWLQSTTLLAVIADYALLLGVNRFLNQAQHLNAFQIGQGPIQHHQIEACLLELGQGFSAIRCFVAFKTDITQGLVQQLQQFGVIVDNQQSFLFRRHPVDSSLQKLGPLQPGNAFCRDQLCCDSITTH